MKWLWLFPSSLFSAVKLVVLVIVSDHFPVYLELQQMWKSYAAHAPEGIEVYFLRADPDLPEPYRFCDHTIWARTSEGWSPDSAGIINKTILAMEGLLEEEIPFNFVLRTNLSSFYHFPRLLSVLNHLPRIRCYFGSSTDGNKGSVASGCGYVLSKDLVELLVRHKGELMDRPSPEDDVLVGAFLHDQHIQLIRHRRLDLLSLKDWEKWRDEIPGNIFHIRVKATDRRSSPLVGDNEYGIMDDIYIHRKLFELFVAQNQ